MLNKVFVLIRFNVDSRLRTNVNPIGDYDGLTKFCDLLDLSNLPCFSSALR